MKEFAETVASFAEAVLETFLSRSEEISKECLDVLKRRSLPNHPALAEALSANITETPATFGITVGRWR